MLRVRSLVAVVSLLVVALLSTPPQPPVGAQGMPLLPSPRVFRVVAAPFLHLTADYYWLQLLNQVGRAQTAEDARNVYAYADLATDLDPRFASVYTFGGIAIPFSIGRETWVNTEESTRLLRKGGAALPDHYGIHFLLAYNLIFFEHRYREAAEVLVRISKSPEAPDYLPALATRLFAASGDFDAGLTVAATLMETAEDEETRAFFEQRTRELEQERRLRELDATAERFRAREGHPPRTLSELVARGDLAAIPEDPLGGEFVLDAQGRAHSTAAAKRLVLHDFVKQDEP